MNDKGKTSWFDWGQLGMCLFGIILILVCVIVFITVIESQSPPSQSWP